jgi:biopolymer transport protein ExbB/TolQ
MTDRSRGLFPFLLAALGAISWPVVIFVIVLFLGFPILLLGLGAVFVSYKLIFSSGMSGSVPIWAVVVVGIMAIYLLKPKRYSQY